MGLDGLSYNMLRRFDVEFPYLETVLERGVSGDLMSVDTPTTIPAWTSFATGKDPGTHGVHNMKEQHPDYRTGPSRVNATDAGIYDLLEDAIFVNLPATAGREPAAEDTLLVSYLLESDKESMTPPELRSLDAYEDYVPMHDTSMKTNPDRYLEHVLDIVESRGDFAAEAFETYDPRVGFVLFSAPDWAGHILSNIRSDEKRASFYRRIVEAVGDETEDLAGLADNVVLMSDHGFEHKHTNVHLADWLHDRGYFVEREDDGVDPFDIAVGAAKSVARRSDRALAFFRFVHNRLLGTDLGAELQSAARPDVDYPNSRAWQLRYACIYLNDDRFESPQVDDPEALREELVESLEGVVDDDGDPVFRDVLRPEEAYEDPGPDVPDVICRPAPHHFPITHWSPTGEVTSPTSNFEHRYRGVFLGDGPLFAGGSVEGMSIVDVLPTVMAALGEPLPPDFDGEPRLDLLADGTHPGTMDPGEVPDPVVTPESESERSAREEKVTERLADLGYMER